MRHTRLIEYQPGTNNRLRPIAAVRLECWSEPRPARGRGPRGTGCLRVPRRHPDGWRLLLYLRQPVPRRPRPSASERADTRARATDAVKVAERQDGLACSAQVKEEAAAAGRRPGDTKQSTPARPGAPASNCQSGHRLPRRDEAAGKRTSTNDRNGPKADCRATR